MTPYAKWIYENVKGTGLAQCGHYTALMNAAFPELRRARGLYYCYFWGTRTHWWLIGPNGEIVDPTAAQFPSQGTGRYEELTDEEVEAKVPMGRCANCGDDIYKGGYSSMLCSKECAADYAAYCNSPN